MQEALARAFAYERSFGVNNPQCYFRSIVPELLPKRDKMVQMCRDAGMEPIVPQSGYFMIADYSKLSEFVL